MTILATNTAIEGVILAPLDRSEQRARLAELGLVATEIAHDLGNLMQIIESGLRSMERRFDEKTSPDLKYVTGEVSAAVTRASLLTRKILETARGASAAVEAIDVGALITDLRVLIGWAAGSDVEVKLDVEPCLPRVFCKPASLESAVMNLVVNARHAMPSGGSLKLSVLGQGKTIVLRVTDTGCGMSAAAARRACEPFISTRTNNGGTGLGLAIVTEFVQALGGSISVESELGRGTAIALTFPIHPADL